MNQPPESEEIVAEQQRRRGIYLLPNLLTTAALFFGFFAIVSAMGDQFEKAAIGIFLAMIFDGLDGRIARLTNTQSAFGAEYDSLSDMVSFGLAPALVIYEWSLHSLGKLGWLAAFIYTAAAALRLARFNTQLAQADKRYFQGLASPAAAAIIAGLVWVGSDYHFTGVNMNYIAFGMTILTGLLMVSNIRYFSFKDFDARNRVPFVALLIIVLVFVLISIDPPQVLFAAFLIYLFSGPVLTVVIRLKVRRRKNLPPNHPT